MRPTVATGAVLFTDMVGSTALLGRLGDEAADRLRHDHDALVAEAVSAHGGEVLRWTGDGVKAAFGTATDAVGAAIDIRRAISDYAISARAVAAFQLRMGVAAGEVLIEEGDHHGVPVIEAARLEALARPGDILATDVVRALTRRRADVAFEGLGERILKGLDEPVEVFRLIDRTALEIPDPPLRVPDGAPPLIGRERQLATFVETLGHARAGRSGLLVVGSPHGHGATRFLAECAAAAHERGALVVSGACTSERAAPYEPFVEALGRVASFDPEFDVALRDPGRPLSRLFATGAPWPSAATGASSAADAQPASARLDLFDAVVATLGRISRVHPLVLMVDDLHRASESTLRLVQHVVTHLVDERLVVVATVDDQAVPDERTRPVEELRARVGTVEVQLDPFGEDALLELVRRAAPHLSARRAAEAASDLDAAGAVTPLLAAALLDHLIEGGRLDAGGDIDRAVEGRATVPAAVREVVLRAVDDLGPRARSLLAVAGVIGPTVDVDVLHDVVSPEVTPEDLVDVLASAHRSGVLGAVEGGRTTFTRSIVRTCLLEALAPQARRALHRRVAEVLESRPGVAPDVTAHQWRRAGDDARAVTHLLAAARRDLTALAYESARTHSQDAVELLARDPGATASVRAEAWLSLGVASRALNDLTYRQAILRAARLAEAAGDGRILGEAAAMSVFPGSFFFVAEQLDLELIELCRAALGRLDHLDPMRVRVLASLASHLTFDPDPSERRALIDEALDLATRYDDPHMTADVLNAEFVCLWEPATLERRAEIARELGRIGRATGDQAIVFLGAFFATFCTAERGALTEASVAAQQLVSLAAASRNQYFEFLAERLSLSLDLAREVPGVAARVDALATRHGGTAADTEGTWAVQTGWLAHRAGTLDRMVGVMQAMTTGNQARTWTAALALATLCAGDLAAAEALLVEQGEVPKNYFWITVAQVQSEVAAAVGATDHCRRLFAELLPARGRVGITSSGALCYGLVSRSLGELAGAMGDHEQAVELLAEAVAHADLEGMAFEGVVSRRLLAVALRAAGCMADAAAVVAEASTVAHELGLARESALLASLSD